MPVCEETAKRQKDGREERPECHASMKYGGDAVQFEGASSFRRTEKIEFSLSLSLTLPPPLKEIEKVRERKRDRYKREKRKESKGKK